MIRFCGIGAAPVLELQNEYEDSTGFSAGRIYCGSQSTKRLA
jgi:hypothetical protein